MEAEQPAQEQDFMTVRVARRCYVGNLAWKTSWQDLKDHFRSAGHVVHADVMREPDTQRSKGCGIVEFDTPEAAANAIQSLNDTYLDGRLIFVREDREDHDLKGPGAKRGGGGTGRGAGRGAGVTGGGAGRGGGTKEVGRRLFVSNLDFATSWQDLKDHFRQVGSVARADVMKDENGRSRGLGTVEMDSPDDALSAISMLSNSELGGRQILVREDRQEGR